MTDLFLEIVNMSISASWLVLAVLLLRLLWKGAPKWVNVLLWGLVAFRLVCPFTVESALSLVPSAQTVSPEIMMDWTPEIDTGIPALNQVVNPVITDTFAPEPMASANPLQILIPVAAQLWILGMVLLLAHAVVSYWQLRRKVQTAVVLRGNIYQSDGIDTPFVLGIVKPKIYLPFSMSEENLRYVLAHERAHIRRRDHWWKPLGFLLLTVHWFNPLMWVAYLLLCRDIELACDETVIRDMDGQRRANYAAALLACSTSHRLPAACPIAFGEVGVKARIKSVMNYKKPTFWIILAAVAVCAVVSVCFLTNPEGPEAFGELPDEVLTGPHEETVADEPPVLDQEELDGVSSMWHYMCFAIEEGGFRSMEGEEKEILAEYGNLLDDYSVYPTTWGDGSRFFIVGRYNGPPEEDPFNALTDQLDHTESGMVQLLNRDDSAGAEYAAAAQKISQSGYRIEKSTVYHLRDSGYILIHPMDWGWGLRDVYNRYMSPKWREYMPHAIARGIAIATPDEGPYLEVTLLSEQWGEVSEIIPLTEEQVTKILSERRKKLDEGYGFMARLELGPNSSINVEEDACWFTEFTGVPKTVLDLAVEKCEYKFFSPKDLKDMNESITGAKLECSWLEEPLSCAEEDLPRLQAILENAEYEFVGNCGYGAKLTIKLPYGRTKVLYKSTDGCDTIVFGSYGGYAIGDEENREFWELFGLDINNLNG